MERHDIAYRPARPKLISLKIAAASGLAALTMALYTPQVAKAQSPDSEITISGTGYALPNLNQYF